jgi:hypothetical protein
MKFKTINNSRISNVIGIGGNVLQSTIQISTTNNNNIRNSDINSVVYN